MNDVISTLGSLFGAVPGALTNTADPLAGALSGGLNTVAALAGAPGVGEALGAAGAGAGSLGSTALEGLSAGVGGGIGDILSAGAGALGSAAGGLGASAEALAAPTAESLGSSLVPDIGGMGLATGIESQAGGVGSEFAGILNADALGSTLPTGPGTANLASPTLSAAPLDLSAGANAGLSAGVEAGAGPASALEQFISNPTLSGSLDALLANKDLIGAGAAAIPLLTGNSAMPGQEQLNSLAQQMSGSSAALTGYLNSGTLPPGVQSGLKSANESAKAAMRSMFASRGMSGSSSEASALANIDQTTAAQGAEIAMKLLDKGIQQQQMSSALYQVILRNAMEEDKSFGEAIGRFGAAMAA